MYQPCIFLHLGEEKVCLMWYTKIENTISFKWAVTKKLINMSNYITYTSIILNIDYIKPDFHGSCPEYTRFYILHKNLQEYGCFTKPKSRVSTVINVNNSFWVLAKLIVFGYPIK